MLTAAYFGGVESCTAVRTAAPTTASSVLSVFVGSDACCSSPPTVADCVLSVCVALNVDSVLFAEKSV